MRAAGSAMRKRIGRVFMECACLRYPAAIVGWGEFVEKRLPLPSVVGHKGAIRCMNVVMQHLNGVVDPWDRQLRENQVTRLLQFWIILLIFLLRKSRRKAH